MLQKMAGFCGMEVITYCMMSNHFHVLVLVPTPQQLTDAQLLERLEGLYGARGTLTLLAREAMTQRGKIDEDIRRKLLERMGDVSAFIKELKIKEVIAQGGELSLGQVLRLRVRHLSDGVALGTKAFVNEVFTRYREKFGPKRKDGARPIRALASIGLNALRDLRVRALG